MRIEKIQRICFCQIAILMLVLGFNCPVVGAEAQLPQWIAGSYWDYTTETTVHLQEEGASTYADITITDENTRYNLTGIEAKTLTHGSALTYDAYVLPFTGTVEGEGTYHVAEPFPMDIPVELRNGTLTGEWWVDSATLATVYMTRNMQGDLWANILGSWQEVGTAEIEVTEEYEPGRLWAAFPLDVDDSWLQDITFYTYGDYVIDGELMGNPIHEEDTFDEAQVYQLDITCSTQETSHGYDTYRMDGSETGSSGTIQTNYGPEPQNIVYDELLDFAGSGSVQVEGILRTLTDYYLESAGPTPTPGDCINHGDVSLDGEVTAGDAQLAFLIALGSYPPTLPEECAADCNGDGEVTAGDAQAVFLVALGSSPSCADPV